MMKKIIVKEARNIKEKVKGLIGADKPAALMLKTRFGIHTFGVKFPIDVLILDDKNKVISMKENLKPNRIFLWNPRFKIVIELPRGSIKKNKLKVNMPIDISIL